MCSLADRRGLLSSRLGKVTDLKVNAAVLRYMLVSLFKPRTTLARGLTFWDEQQAVSALHTPATTTCEDVSRAYTLILLFERERHSLGTQPMPTWTKAPPRTVGIKVLQHLAFWLAGQLGLRASRGAPLTARAAARTVMIVVNCILIDELV